MIDLLSIKPHKVSRDLSGYVTYIYGPGGVGKTTLASQMDKALLLACEKGYSAIPGIMAQDITSWAELKQAARDLKKPQVQEAFKCICVDTIDLAADFCEKYICNREGVEKLGDIAWGGGFKMMKKEFEETFRTIAQLGYALFFISHSKDKVFKREEGSEYNQVVPSLAPASNEIIRNMSDIQGYAHPVQFDDGTSKVMLTLRSPDNSIECKSRFKYMTPEVEFNYQALSKALADAIDYEAGIHDNAYITDAPEPKMIDTTPNFDAMMDEFVTISHKIQDNVGRDEWRTKWAPKIGDIVAKYIGKGKKVKDMTPAQVDMLSLILDDLKEEVGNGL